MCAQNYIRDSSREGIKPFLKNPRWPLFISVSIATAHAIDIQTVFLLSGTTITETHAMLKDYINK